jgi:hypothetical protein
MSEPARNDYDDGHLLVAAVRLLMHRNGRPPTVEECAGLAGFSVELTHALVRRLEEYGAVRAVETPFEARVVIEDHTALEAIPRDATGPSVASEFESFRDRQKEKQKELDKLFGEGSLEKKKKERVSSLEEQFKKFRATRQYRPPASAPPAPSGDESAGDEDD